MNMTLHWIRLNKYITKRGEPSYGFDIGTYPKGYVDELSPLSNEIKFLADEQLCLLENNFIGIRSS
jgi:hypothetical protein